MTDNTAPDIVEIAPAADGLNPMAGEGPTAEAVDEKPKEKPSIEDSLKKAFKASEEKESNPKAEKPVVEKPIKEAAPKVEANNVEESTAEKPAVDEKARVEKKPSEGRKFDTAPSRMIPEASAKWANVPNEVKAEVYRAFDDFEREKQTYSEHVKFREELKEYEDLGKQHGVTVKDALQNYVGIERKFYESPADGFRQLLSNMNMQPQQAISHILSAFNVTPQALAQHMAQNPQAYTAQHRQVQQPQQSSPASPEMQAMKAEIESLKADKETEKVNRVYNEMISPFFEKYADAETLWPTIEIHLLSGTIEKIHGESLRGDKKLLEAYRMAGGQFLPSRSETLEENQQHSRTEKRPVNPDAGKLSIGGSPNAGDIKSTTRKKAAPSIDDALANAIRRAS